jgi:Protein of unknown function (DUF2800)
VSHSNIVGGSTAKRVINCPGSVKLCQQVPPKPSSSYADTGTLLHTVIADLLGTDKPLRDLIGMEYNGIVFDQEMAGMKILPAIEALNEIDKDETMEFAVEQTVGFGDLLPGVFGSCDLIGRIGDRAVILDWKFGDGVAVEADENPQLMFYAAAAMRTPSLSWVFDGAKEVECIIVQPPSIKRWVTSFDRLRMFERELVFAVKQSEKPDAALHAGEHCRWCAAKPICPQMTGAADRALAKQVKELNTKELGLALVKADMLEEWIKDLRALAIQVLEKNGEVPGYKLVQKRGTRQWIDEQKATEALLASLPESEVIERSLVSPAQAEKKLKKLKLALPDGLTTSVSSGTTLASVDDPRPAVLQIGQQLTAALTKLM